jgi:protocatechuate 3,4-dioxygenase beta subunit
MLQTPQINVTIFSRGLLEYVFTRPYFPDEPLNAPVLNTVPRDRRSTPRRQLQCGGAGQQRLAGQALRSCGDLLVGGGAEGLASVA